MTRVVVIPSTHPQRPSAVVRREGGEPVDVTYYVPAAAVAVATRTPRGLYGVLARLTAGETTDH